MSTSRRIAAGAVLAACTLSPLAAFAGDPTAPAAPSASAPATKAWTIVYKTKIPAAPEGTKRLEAWIPTPYVDDVQKVRDLKIEASVPYQTTEDPATRNRFVHVLVENPKGDVQVDWSAVVERSVDEGQGTGPVLDAYLKSDSKASVDGRAKKLADELLGDKSSAPAGTKARLIYDDVLKTMTYDKVTPGWGKGDFDRACDLGKGNCSDFVAKFVTLSRAAGIPARWTSSISLSGEHMDCSACGYHCYAHYRDGDHWIPVDASDARKILEKDPAKAQWFFGHAEANNVILSVGRDLTLVPKQQAGPVNFLAGPYVEVDGKPVEVPSKNRTYGHEPVVAPGAAPVAPAKPAPAAK